MCVSTCQVELVRAQCQVEFKSSIVAKSRTILFRTEKSPERPINLLRGSRTKKDSSLQNKLFLPGRVGQGHNMSGRVCF